MKDIYGIGLALETAFDMYSRAAIHTGRTTHLIELVRDGDMVIFHNQSHLRHFKNQLKDKRPRTDLKLVVVNIRDGHADIEKLIPVKGAVHFDHSFIEEHYRSVIKNASGLFDYITDKFSRKPERKEQPIMRTADKWRF